MIEKCILTGIREALESARKRIARAISRRRVCTGKELTETTMNWLRQSTHLADDAVTTDELAQNAVTSVPPTCPMCAAANDVPISDDELAAAEAAGTICGQCAEVVAENREAMQGALIAGGSALAKIGRCGEDNLPCGVCAECLEELACS